jgi:protein phosphatase
MPRFDFSIAYYTNPGKVRKNNEDALLVGEPIKCIDMREPVTVNFLGRDEIIFGVADGIGGANAGEVASRIVVEGLLSLKNFHEGALVAKLNELNLEIHTQSQVDSKLYGMGTTVAGMAFGNGTCFIYHVGDCRVYRIKDGFFQQLTEDDTMAQLLQNAGQADSNAIRGENEHVLLQALGGLDAYSEITPHVRSHPLQPNNRFMICSDGVTDFLGLDEMEESVLPDSSVESCARNLIAALEATSQKDNISFIIIDLKTN